jgi:DNA-binding transcriptional LysR family regulator
MEIRHLRYAIALSEELNFRRAAERLHISQPPLSQQLKAMEEELGVSLFKRSKRKVELTPAGEIFIQSARVTLSHFEKMLVDTKDAGLGKTGLLSIGFVGSTVFSILPKILKRFRKQYPNVKLNLVEKSTMDQLSSLRAGEIDVALVRLPPKMPDIDRKIILEDQIMAAVPLSHAMAKASEIAVKDLAEDGFVIFPRSASIELYDQIISICKRSGFSPKVVQEVVEMTTIVGLVSAEVGVALIPESVTRIRMEGVRFLSLSDRVAPVNFTLCTRKGESSVYVKGLLECAQFVVDAV